mmetsp:Transcript_20208/g.41720  ORF Transcript_20208/g.41720 Transcript_20208/m.41720 type:complete len:266 (-) Transcript_20208:784-1581(-)
MPTTMSMSTKTPTPTRKATLQAATVPEDEDEAKATDEVGAAAAAMAAAAAGGDIGEVAEGVADDRGEEAAATRTMAVATTATMTIIMMMPTWTALVRARPPRTTAPRHRELLPTMGMAIAATGAREGIAAEEAVEAATTTTTVITTAVGKPARNTLGNSSPILCLQFLPNLPQTSTATTTTTIMRIPSKTTQENNRRQAKSTSKSKPNGAATNKSRNIHGGNSSRKEPWIPYRSIRWTNCPIRRLPWWWTSRTCPSFPGSGLPCQ